jgi:hypothetical protein
VRLLIAAALIATTLTAQGFDPVQKGSGWARMDKDGSLTLLDGASASLRMWHRDAGEMGVVPLTRFEGAPEKWAIDSYGNAWVVSGDGLYYVEAKTGKVTLKERLPGEVADLAWDIRGFVLAYKGTEPYVEKRDYRAGGVLWTYGAKSRKAGGSAYRIAVTDDGQVLLASGASLPLTQIEGAKGKALGQTAFSFNGLAAPDLILGGTDRGPLVTWGGHSVAFMSVNGRQIPEAKMSGTLLARLDLAQSTLEFLPTGLPEDHVLVGVHEGQAFLLKPGGGLAFVPVR